jgi:Calcineurin-like phosphoesterase superfamily domain
VQKASRVAAIYDIHGNPAALEAVLADLQSINPDLMVVGGDVVAGPMPDEVLDHLVALGDSICFVRGNADREVVAAYDDRPHADPIDVADPAERTAAYAASRIDREHRDLLASFAEHLIVEVEGLGQGGTRAGLVLPRLTQERRGDRECSYDRRAPPRDPYRGRSRPRRVRAHPCPV